MGSGQAPNESVIRDSPEELTLKSQRTRQQSKRDSRYTQMTKPSERERETHLELHDLAVAAVAVNESGGGQRGRRRLLRLLLRLRLKLKRLELLRRRG